MLERNKPNHICKNPACRKRYRACDSCNKVNHWTNVACSVECYQEYMRLIELSRSPAIEDDVFVSDDGDEADYDD